MLTIEDKIRNLVRALERDREGIEKEITFWREGANAFWEARVRFYLEREGATKESYEWAVSVYERCCLHVTAWIDERERRFPSLVSMCPQCRGPTDGKGCLLGKSSSACLLAATRRLQLAVSLK